MTYADDSNEDGSKNDSSDRNKCHSENGMTVS